MVRRQCTMLCLFLEPPEFSLLTWSDLIEPTGLLPIVHLSLHPLLAGSRKNQASPRGGHLITQGVPLAAINPARVFCANFAAVSTAPTPKRLGSRNQTCFLNRPGGAEAGQGCGRERPITALNIPVSNRSARAGLHRRAPRGAVPAHRLQLP